MDRSKGHDLIAVSLRSISQCDGLYLRGGDGGDVMLTHELLINEVARGTRVHKELDEMGVEASFQLDERGM
jgi:hypothetical protein